LVMDLVVILLVQTAFHHSKVLVEVEAEREVSVVDT